MSSQGQGGLDLLNAPELRALGVAEQLAVPLPAATTAAQRFLAPDQDFSSVVDLAQGRLRRRFLEETLPLIQTQASLAGTGRSGAVLDQIRKGERDVTEALVPFMQQDIQNRLNLIPTVLQAGQSAIQPLTSIGATAEQRPAQRATDLFNVEGQLRERGSASAANLMNLAEAERRLRQEAETAGFEAATGRPQALAESLLAGLVSQVPSGAFGVQTSPQLGFRVGVK